MSTRSPGSIRRTADHTVVSVGPYMFQSERYRANNKSARSSDQGSPPHETFKSALPFHWPYNNKHHVVGVACITEFSAPEVAKSVPLHQPPAPRLASTTRPPQTSGRSDCRIAGRIVDRRLTAEFPSSSGHEFEFRFRNNGREVRDDHPVERTPPR